MPRQEDFSAPACARFAALWDRLAERVHEIFPASSAMAVSNKAGVLAAVEATRIEDAYNSLAIEGYNVTPELVRRVSEPGWNPGQHSDEERLHG